ncbi:MAG: hypothetical protein NVS3B10_01220 [Polyangiales bacterium]
MLAMAADPLTPMVQKALDQGWAHDELVLLLADPASEPGARLTEAGAKQAGGVVVGVLPKKKFDAAFFDAPDAVADALAAKPPKGAVHAVQIDEQGEWSVGTFSVG